VRLGWVIADEKEELALDKVRERLRQEGEGPLLIYDNAIDSTSLKPYLPSGGAARVLVTSNAHAWRGLAAPVEIRLWPKQIGADYLIARTGRDKERADAEALSQALGGLPLAHEQAAAYCERLEVSLAEYVKRFAALPARLLDTAKDAPAEYHDRLTVAKSFALAIDEASKLHPAAEPLIIHASLLAPEPIPLFLFSEGREKFGEPMASQLSGDGLDEAVGALRAFALVDRETILDERDPSITADSIRLHRLVRAVAGTRLQGEAAEGALRALLEVMAAVYPDSVYNDPDAWSRARLLDALALDLVAGPRNPPSGAELCTSYLLDRLGSYRQRALAAYAEGRRLIERALDIRERAFGSEHSLTANEPQQPRSPAEGPRRSRRRAAAPRAGAGDPREGPWPRSQLDEGLRRRDGRRPRRPRPRRRSGGTTGAIRPWRRSGGVRTGGHAKPYGVKAFSFRRRKQALRNGGYVARADESRPFRELLRCCLSQIVVQRQATLGRLSPSNRLWQIRLTQILALATCS
jgi:hypothetical protein